MVTKRQQPLRVYGTRETLAARAVGTSKGREIPLCHPRHKININTKIVNNIRSSSRELHKMVMNGTSYEILLISRNFCEAQRSHFVVIYVKIKERIKIFPIP